MATQTPPWRTFADEASGADAAASSTDVETGAPRAPKKPRASRRTRLIVFSVIPVVAIAAGTLSMTTGLFGKKSAASTQTPIQQAEAALNAGITAENNGNVATARADYQRVLALAPGNEYAYYNLGVIDEAAGNTAQAEKEYRQALTTDPNLEVALFNLAIIRTAADPQEAIDLYNHAITIDPRDAGAHLNLGFLLEAQGQRQQGISELDLAIGIDPTLKSRVPAADLVAAAPPAAPKR